MANQNILTYAAKINEVKQAYFAPSAVLPGTYNQNISTTYCFLSRVDPYPDEVSPPIPTQDQFYTKKIFGNMFVAKKINSGDISPVIPRVDWTSGTIYSFYQDNFDMFPVDTNDIITNVFYIKNRYDQVFKCLWNNNGQPSTVEPIFQPGAFSSTNIFQSTGINADGYKWKYMYSIDVGSKIKFLDSSWMPVAVGSNTPQPYLTSAGYGGIEVINVNNGGSGYTANAVVTVAINGDGTGAEGIAVANTTTGIITDIIVTNTGSNYTYATVSITSTTGFGATAIAPTSPIGGHGYDNISELGCNHVMYTTEFNGSENGYLPTDVNYRQVGLLINPTEINTFPNPANASIYKCSTDLVLAAGQGSFSSDDFVYQGPVLSPTFSATVLSFDSVNNVLKLINTTGTPSINSTIFDITNGTVRTILSLNSINFIKYSGYLAYVENRTGVQRSSDGIEQFRFVLGY